MEDQLVSYSIGSSVVESSYLNHVVPSQQNDSTSRRSSRFVGVKQLYDGKWGARTWFSGKTCWLGFYETEDEAAMAYDRAIIKLQRGNLLLNFPRSTYSPQEMLFQSQFSDQEVLAMIKGKTYSSKLANFLLNPSVTMGNVSSRSMNKEGVSYQWLFQRVLKHSDTNSKFFRIPKQCALEYFPSLGDTSSQSDGYLTKYEDISLYDRFHRSWIFRYSYWKSARSFLLAKGWKHFVKMNDLKPNDTVSLYRCEYVEEGGAKDFIMIDVHRHNRENYSVSEDVERERSPGGDVPNGVNAAVMGEDNIGRQVKLFGVWIN